MKRSNVYKLAAVLAVFVVMSAFTGCSKSDTGTQSSRDESKVSVTSTSESTADSKSELSSEGKDESSAESKASTNGEASITGTWASEGYGGGFVYTFNEDGTGQYDMMGTVLDLTYSVDGDKITIQYLAEGYSPMTLNYTLTSDKFTLFDSSGTENAFVRK